MTQPEPPLSPERTQWSDDGTTWWDGTSWIPRAAVPQRQVELEQEAAARLQREQADYASRYAEWQAQQHEAVADGNPFATPGSPGTAVPPPPPPGMVPTYQVPAGPRPTGYATGIWSFVTAMLGVSIAAIVLGHISRSQARKAHLKPNVWSRWGLFFGYTQVVVAVALIAVLIGYGVSHYRDPVENSLDNAAVAEDVWQSAYGSYTPSLGDLAVTHYRPDPGVEVTVESASASSFCIRAQKGDEVRWLAHGGSVSKQPCR